MVPLKTSMPIFIILFFMLLQGCDKQAEIGITAIAHAGGGINGKRYTNSIEALNFNYDRGFELFEIDFSWTADGHMVCLHDWDRTPVWLLNYADKAPLTLNQFKALKNTKLNLTPCNLDSLNQWLISHPNAFIVTDIKNRNIEGLNAMLTLIDDARNRVIPQFSQPEHYPLVKAMGYEKMIWTLYSYKGTDESVVAAAEDMQLYAITMPPHKAKRDLAHIIKVLNIPTYVHTINDLKEALDYQKTYGLTSVYTDFLVKDFNAIHE